MAASTSYRLDRELKRRLAERARIEGVTETSLVTRLLDEGLKTARHPGIVYRDGATGRRAALAGGADVWEVISAVRHAPGVGDVRITNAADAMGVPERLVRVAVNFAAEFSNEVEDRIAANEAAVENARELAAQRARLLAS